MIKDLLENFIREIKNEQNQEHMKYIIEPVYNKIKISYFFIVFLLILILINLFYISMNIHIFKSNLPNPSIPNSVSSPIIIPTKIP
jgi:hypothetical protein